MCKNGPRNYKTFAKKPLHGPRIKEALHTEKEKNWAENLYMDKNKNIFIKSRDRFFGKPLNGPRIRKALYTEKEQTQIYLLENIYMAQESDVLNI